MLIAGVGVLSTTVRTAPLLPTLTVCDASPAGPTLVAALLAALVPKAVCEEFATWGIAAATATTTIAHTDRRMFAPLARRSGHATTDMSSKFGPAIDRRRDGSRVFSRSQRYLEALDQIAARVLSSTKGRLGGWLAWHRSERSWKRGRQNSNKR